MDNLNSVDEPNGIPRLLDVSEVAALLNIGSSTVYQMIRAGELPCIRLGRTVRVDLEDLRAFIQDRKAQGYSQRS